MNDLRSIRKLKGLSQLDLAKLTGVSNVRISNLEAGKSNPQSQTRERIEQVLGCPVDWLSLGKFKVGDSDMRKAEGLVRQLIGMTVLMSKKEQKQIKDLVNKYFGQRHPNSHSGKPERTEVIRMYS